MAQAAQGLGLDLADAFACHTHFAAHFFERVGLSIEQTITQLQNADLAWGQGIQHFAQMFS